MGNGSHCREEGWVGVEVVVGMGGAPIRSKPIDDIYIYKHKTNKNKQAKKQNKTTINKQTTTINKRVQSSRFRLTVCFEKWSKEYNSSRG